ncbi:MAG: Fimbrial protein [candidate division TM6 bacterium GW2011_GWF2_32_72]|nr:MAG: Fimbrial protein [candidate division TM6 bacterium GW2011_GWF2_32_72]
MKKGFSLIELMIVIAIIAFLAVIAVPSFNKFLAKSKRTEAYVNLASIYTAQKAYWAEKGEYSNVLKGVNGIGWEPEGYASGKVKNYYTYGFPGADGVNCFVGKGGGSSSDLSMGKAGKDAFVAIAVADIDGDGTLDILAVNEANEITVIQDDLA